MGETPTSPISHISLKRPRRPPRRVRDRSTCSTRAARSGCSLPCRVPANLDEHRHARSQVALARLEDRADSPEHEADHRDDDEEQEEPRLDQLVDERLVQRLDREAERGRRVRRRHGLRVAGDPHRDVDLLLRARQRAPEQQVLVRELEAERVEDAREPWTTGPSRRRSRPSRRRGRLGVRRTPPSAGRRRRRAPCCSFRRLSATSASAPLPTSSPSVSRTTVRPGAPPSRSSSRPSSSAS